jgi:O-antigen ligase
MQSAVSRDFRTIFWVLAATVIASLAAGTAVGGRLGGIYDNPNTLGIVAAFTAALGMGVAAERGSAPVWLATGLSLLAAVASQNRTGLLGLALAATYLLLRRLPSMRPAAIASLHLLMAAPVAFLLFLGRIPAPAVVGRFEGQDDVLNGRQLAWQYALTLWNREPLNGYGFRVGEAIFQRDRYLTDFTADGAHNSYLQVLLELGVFGALTFALMCIAVITSIMRGLPQGMSLGLAALCITGLMVGVTESALMGVGQPICWVFWLTAAATASVSRRMDPPVGPGLVQSEIRRRQA